MQWPSWYTNTQMHTRWFYVDTAFYSNRDVKSANRQKDTSFSNTNRSYWLESCRKICTPGRWGVQPILMSLGGQKAETSSSSWTWRAHAGSPDASTCTMAWQTKPSNVAKESGHLYSVCTLKFNHIDDISRALVKTTDTIADNITYCSTEEILWNSLMTTFKRG